MLEQKPQFERGNEMPWFEVHFMNDIGYEIGKVEVQAITPDSAERVARAEYPDLDEKAEVVRCGKQIFGR